MNTFYSKITCGTCKCEYYPDYHNSCPQCGAGMENNITGTNITGTTRTAKPVKIKGYKPNPNWGVIK